MNVLYYFSIIFVFLDIMGYYVENVIFFKNVVTAMEMQLKPLKEILEDIYIYDEEVVKKIERLRDSEECILLVERGQSLGSVLPLLDEMLPDKKESKIFKFFSLMKPFYNGREFKTKEDYLQYLKHAYAFMLTPLEVPPGRIVSTFYPTYKKNWSPSSESALELLKKFYVEIKLINELTPRQWERVSIAKNPEAMITKLLYGTRFKPEFENLLRKIPWILSWDIYGSPGLDIIYRRAPGHEMPKKPFGVGESYLDNLAKSSLENQTYTVLNVGEENIKLTDKTQIKNQIEIEGSAHLDSFIGLSKIERDFVIHRRIIIWENPGLKRYQEVNLFKRLIYAKPPRFLCVIREQALPLEITFLERGVDYI